MIEVLSNLDRSLFLSLNGLNFSWLNPIMEILSGQIIWAPFLFLMFWYINRYHDKQYFFYFSFFLVASILASDVSSSYVLKNLFQRLRPCREVDLKPLIEQFGQKCGGRFGFVSSHAANSMTFVTFTILALNLKDRSIMLLWSIPVLIGFSRIYLGVHYPGDILGGLVVGFFWGYLFFWLFMNSRRQTT